MTKRKANNTTRIESLERQVDWVVKEAFQTLADSVAEQASACQAMLKVLAQVHPEKRMVKVQDAEGRVYYEFRDIAEIEAAKTANEEVLNVDTKDE